jgi:hypothetical protein
MERVFRLLQIAHRHEDIRSLYATLRGNDRGARASAVELLDALVQGRSGGTIAARELTRRLLRLVVDELPAETRIARATDLLPRAPKSYEDAIDFMRSEPDEALAALAVYHCTELGLAQPNG